MVGGDMSKWILVLTFAFSVTVFGAPQKAASEGDGADASKALIHAIKLDDYLKNLQPNEVLEKMDSSGKGDADIFIIFKKNDDGSRQLVTQLFDLNRDKKIDLVKHFEKGHLVRTEADLDYDGYVDVVSDYDPQSGELKKKIQADGATNIWKYYFHNELRKKEVDRNSDGKPDMWVYYRNGKILRTEIDQNFNGKIVRVDGALSPNKGKRAVPKSGTSLSE